MFENNIPPSSKEPSGLLDYRIGATQNKYENFIQIKYLAKIYLCIYSSTL